MGKGFKPEDFWEETPSLPGEAPGHTEVILSGGDPLTLDPSELDLRTLPIETHRPYTGNTGKLAHARGLPGEDEVQVRRSSDTDPCGSSYISTTRGK